MKERHPSRFRGKGYGALLTFGLENEKACFDFIRNVKLAYHLANGITPDLVRVSVGIEAIEDILDDFDQALRAI